MNKPWTTEDDKAALASGLTNRERAARLGRTVYAVKKRAALLRQISREWSGDDIEYLTEQYLGGAPISYIAMALGFSREVVRAKIADLRLRPPAPPKYRECLRCGGKFRSSGPSNRLCVCCNARTSGLSQMAEGAAL